MSEQFTNNPSVSEPVGSNESIVSNSPATTPEAEGKTNETVNVSETAQRATGNFPNASENEQVIDALQKEIALLKEQLAEQSEKAENFKTQYIRIAADFDNFRKRTSKDKETLEHQVKRNTINELLPVIDNFERARTQIKPTNDGEKAIHKSYQGLYKIFVDSLKRIGVSPMRPEGQPFDPNYHEAMLREPNDEYPEGTVIEELMRGYLLEDQVLRHAMVKVSAGKETDNSTQQELKSES